MDTKGLRDFLFGIMNENNALFLNISLDDETDTIFTKTVEGKNFIITVSPVTADEAIINLWAKKNPELMSIALNVVNMRDLGEITEEEADRFLSELVKRADNSSIKI